MSRSEITEGSETSMFRVGATLLHYRWRILRLTIGGGVVAAAFLLAKPPVYSAYASFVPQSSDGARSGLANLAGQFGVAIPAGNQQFGPDFYTRLLKTRVLLRAVARDTFVVEEMGGKRTPFAELFGVKAKSARYLDEQSEKRLTELVQAPTSKPTGIVSVSVTTRWPSVSLAIVQALIKGVNDFNQATRQGQAAAERQFVETRLALADSDLRQAEDRLEEFLKRNRQFSNSPELTFERERLQRDLTLKQQTFTTLTQSYDEVRIREVRNTPVITMVDQATVDFVPEPRGRAVGILLGLVLGGIVGMLMAFLADTIDHRSRAGDTSVVEFLTRLAESRADFMGRLGQLRRRQARKGEN